MKQQSKFGRREFLTVAGAGALAAGTNIVCAGETTKSPKPITVAGEYDIIVCGGGTSGLPAAVAAARQGAKVAIIEKYGFLGGNAVYSIMPAWWGITKCHSGLLTEFARRVGKFGMGPDPLENRHIEPEVTKILFLKMALEAGVKLYLHRFIVGVEKENETSRIESIITESKSGRHAFKARIFIDATGDGDISYHAGADYMKGDSGRMQGMTLRFRIGFIDMQRYFDWALRHPEYYKNTREQLLEMKRQAVEGKDFMISSSLSKMWEKDPDKELPRNTYFNSSSIRPDELSVNTTRIYDVDGTNADDLTRAEITTRRQAFAVWRYLKKNVPGFEKSRIVETAPQVGVRETRAIVGDYILKDEDCRALREFEDSVLTCPVNYDAHDKEKYKTFSVRGGLVDIPYRCFLPKGIEGLLVVGRCLSSDHLTNSAIRGMQTAFQGGQIGGIAAALAVKNETMPRKLPFPKLLVQLKKNGLLTSQAHRKETGRIYDYYFES